MTEVSTGSTSEEGVRVVAGSSTNYTFVVGAAASTGGDEVVVSATRQSPRTSGEAGATGGAAGVAR